MIQATGTITKQDGVTSYVNPLINVYFASPMKGVQNIIAAQVCTSEQVEEEEEVVTKHTAISDGMILQTSFAQENPSFNQAQDVLLAALRTGYPNVTFEII